MNNLLLVICSIVVVLVSSIQVGDVFTATNPIKCLVRTSDNKLGYMYGRGCALTASFNVKCEDIKIKLGTTPYKFAKVPLVAVKDFLTLPRVEVKCYQDNCLMELDVIRAAVEAIRFEYGIETAIFRKNACRTKVAGAIVDYLRPIVDLLKEHTSRLSPKQQSHAEQKSKMHLRRRRRIHHNRKHREIPVDLFL